MALRDIEYKDIVAVAERLEKEMGKFPSIERVRADSGYASKTVYEAVTKLKRQRIAWEELGDTIAALEKEVEHLRNEINKKV